MSVLEVLAPGLGLLALGCVLLAWGADEFMEHLAGVARAVGLPTLALGLLLAGAEPEELATAVIASSEGHPVLAATDAVGANVTMLTLGLGLALLVQPVVVGRVLRRYVGFAVLAGVLAAAALYDGEVARWEGGVLCAAFVVIVAVIWRSERRPPRFGELAEGGAAAAFADAGGTSGAHHAAGGHRPRGRDLTMLLAGLVAMVLGGALAVDGAARIAAAAGLGEHATGLSALAFATSAEVLALVVAARRRALTEVAVGGVLGSALYNATLTLGISSLVAPLAAPGLFDVALIASALPLVLLLGVRARVPRTVGAMLGLGYACYLVAVFQRAL